jgi:glycerophosphoryl diester phosphodiesterase
LNDGFPPRVIGHRGAAGSAPENTIASFRRAAELGCRWVEFDVQLSADDVPILFHDSSLSRTTNGAGRLTRVTLDGLKKLDAGSWFGADFAGEKIPTLAEALLEIAKLGLIPNIEIKSPRAYAAQTARLAIIEAFKVWPKDAPLPFISSFSPEALVQARKVVPNWPRGYLSPYVTQAKIVAAQKLGCASFGLALKRVDAKSIAQLHDSGFLVFVYTVNDRNEAERLFALGVDGLFSDRPDEIVTPKGDSG